MTITGDQLKVLPTSHGVANLDAATNSPDPWFSGGFTPDFVVPQQFYDLTRRGSAAIGSGERRLLFAVLEDAIRCYVKNAHATRRGQRAIFEEADRWFTATSGSRQPFSYEYVCDVLGIDADVLREQLKHLSPGDLPGKQTRAVGRRHLVRVNRRSHRAQPQPQQRVWSL